MISIGSKFKDNFDRIDWSKHEPYQPKRADPPRRSALPCPMVISDTMEPTEHVDGRYYTSKSKFRAVTKAHGCVEVGNDPARLRRPSREVLNQMARPARHAAIKKAMDKAGL